MSGIVIDLQWFAEEGMAAAAGTESAGSAGIENAAGTENVNFQAGDTLPDGQQVQSAQVAAELRRQMQRHPELRKVYGQTPKQGMKQGNPNGAAAPKGEPADAGTAGQQAPEDTIQTRWEALKKGEYKELYGADVQAAVRERFKNQADAQAELDKVQDVLELLRGKAGVETNDELLDLLRNDDSLIEDEAEAAGMTVERYREFKALKDEHEQRQAQDEADREKAAWDNHFAKMAAQAEELRQKFPEFNLDQEMQNEQFRRLTHPSVGVSVEDAYRVIHRDEIDKQLMAYGMNRTRQQMGQTIQAQHARPQEGAMRSQGQQAANVAVDFSQMDRKQRDEYRRKVLSGLIKGGNFA